MRQYISLNDFDNKGMLKIQGKDYRYLKQVLRLKSGDMLNVRTPSGELYNSTVCLVNEEERFILLQLCDISSEQGNRITRGVQAEQIQSENESFVEYWLFQYIAKPSKMEQIIRQAVECGISYIVPVIGEYSQKQNVSALNSGKKERIERIIKEARQQSGSPVQTQMLSPVSTSDACSIWKKELLSDNEEQNSKAVVLWERNENTKALQNIFDTKTKRVGIAVGCEGGLSREEVNELCKAGFVPIHFAGNILRCETASIYGIAAVQTTLREN